MNLDVDSTLRRRWVDVARSDWLDSLLPAVVAGVLALVPLVLRWRGGDLAAQTFRVGLVERDGFEVWNNYWFGGHHTVGYGPLFPVLGAALGIWTMAVVSAAASAWLVDRVVRRGTGIANWQASLWFAVSTLSNVAVGRLAFGLGFAIGLAAVLAAQTRHFVVAGVLAAAAALASPVVSVFLVIVFAAWALVSAGRRRWTLAIVGAAAIVPVLIISVVYPQGGTFPFRWSALLWTLVVCAVVAALVPATYRVVRVAALLYGAASVAAFVVATPLGANITRFGMYAAPPVLLATITPRRLLIPILAALAFWQWSPAFDAMVRAPGDRSTKEAYYEPLRAFLRAADTQPARVEVVPTRRHWDTVYVTRDVPIARGWERQLDMRYNHLFYEPGLTAEAYRQWLLEEGVSYVALPDAALDRAGKQEAALLRTGLTFLSPVLETAHWRVWKVTGASGMVEGPATVREVGIDNITLDVHERADIVVRLHGSRYWAATPSVCIESNPDGWITLRDAPVGTVKLFINELQLDRDDSRCQQMSP